MLSHKLIRHGVYSAKRRSGARVSARVSARVRKLSSTAHMINTGRLREINAFSATQLHAHALAHDYDYSAVLDAYSYSSLVHIPVNHLPLHDLHSITTEVLERMLATTLLCQYRTTAITLARELCRRQEQSPSEFHSYGHCVLAYYLSEQWDDVIKYSSSSRLVEYMQQHSITSESSCHSFTGQVGYAVFQCWFRDSRINEVEAVVDCLLHSNSNAEIECFFIGYPNVLRQTVMFLRHHGLSDHSHRLLSYLQHSLQRNVMDTVCGGTNGRSSQANRSINELIAFSTCLHEKEDAKYLANVYNFYLKKVMPRRTSYINRLIDTENIMQSVLNFPVQQMDHKNIIGDIPRPPESINRNRRSKHCQPHRALEGYSFYNNLQRQLRGNYLKSPYIFAQLAEIIAHMDLRVAPLGRRCGHYSQHLSTAFRHNAHIDRRLDLLKTLKGDYFKLNFNKNKSSSPNPRHDKFVSAYISSMQVVLQSLPPSISKIERDSVMEEIVEDFRAFGISSDVNEMISRAVVELYLPLCENVDDLRNFSELKESIDNLITFIDKNGFLFHFDVVCQSVIKHLSDRSRLCPDFARNNVSMEDFNHAELRERESVAQAAKRFSTVSNNICRFLKYLSDREMIEDFHVEYRSSSSEDKVPVQNYRSFRDCSDREWRTIKLIQTSCVQLFNLHHVAVVPDIMVLLSSLSTLQIVPYSYWDQAIKLCEEGKKWDDLKVLVQLLLYQGKMVQFSSMHSVLSAYVSTHSPHVGFRIARAMRREGVSVPAEVYRSICVALGRLSSRSSDGVENAEMAEKAFRDLYDSYGPVAFTGNFDTGNGVDLLAFRTRWVINSRNESMIKKHLKDCGEFITCPKKLRLVYQDILMELPSQYYESGVYLITTMLSRELCSPDDADVDRFIDAAIENDRLTLAASMLRTIKHLKENYELANPDAGESDEDDDDDDDESDEYNLQVY